MLAAASWILAVAFAAAVLVVAIASYGVLFFAFRKEAKPEGDQE